MLLVYQTNEPRRQLTLSARRTVATWSTAKDHREAKWRVENVSSGDGVDDRLQRVQQKHQQQ